MYPVSSGKPVLDLQQSEVELLEDGVPQTIVQFEHVHVSGPRPQTATREPSTMEEMRRAAQDPRARVLVLFLDPRFVTMEGSVRIRRPLIDALNRLIGADPLDRCDDAGHVAARPHVYAANGECRATVVWSVGHTGMDRHSRSSRSGVRGVL
jgi:hypothetical protein